MESLPYAFSPQHGLEHEFPRVLHRVSARLKKLAGHPGHDKSETLHEIRISIKLLRALLWLAKPGCSPAHAFAIKNQLKIAAHHLAGTRDMMVMRATLQELKKESDEPEEHESIEHALRAFALRQAKTSNGVLKKASATLQKAISLMERDCHFDSGKSSARRRLKKAFHLTHQARQKALKTKRALDFHEWRKKAKRLLYLLQLLHADPGKKTARMIKRIDKIQHWLGDHHDHVLLEEQLKKGRPGGLEGSGLKALSQLIGERKRHFRRKAEKAAKRL